MTTNPMPLKALRALYICLGLYLIMSPLASYNTLAMFGLVTSRFVEIQLALTAVMICFAFVASAPLSKHCAHHAGPRSKVFWIIGFYLVGPPVLFAYYQLRFKPATAIDQIDSRLGVEIE
jgi:hypothetical protein